SNNELRQFCVFVRNKPIEEVTRSEIKEWIELHQIALFSEGSIQNKCGTLRVFFRFLRDIGKNVVNPDLIPMFTVERSIPRIPDEQELIKFEKVLLSCK